MDKPVLKEAEALVTFLQVASEVGRMAATVSTEQGGYQVYSDLIIPKGSERIENK